MTSSPTNLSLLIITYLLQGAESFLRSHLVLQLIKKFPAVYGTRKFITVLTSARHILIITAVLFHSNKECIACRWILYALNLLDTTSKFDTVSMFVIVQLPKMLYLQCAGMFCLNTKFHMSTCTSALLSPIRPETNRNFHVVAILLFYVQYKYRFKKC